jgi:sugar phosphate isomerase/epimerase
MDLGVTVSVYEDTDLTLAFRLACDAGLRHGQVNFHIHPIEPEHVREVAVVVKRLGFHVDAVGCYFNPMRPDDATPQLCTLSDWLTIASNMSMLNGVERIVSWSGTLSRSLGAPNLLNQEAGTLSRLFTCIHGLFEQVRGLPIQIVLEPYTNHVLHNAATCVRFTQLFSPGQVQVVLDVTNLIPPQEFGARDSRTAEIVTHIAPAVGIVHLKDMILDGSNHRLFVAAGRGEIGYSAYLKAISEHVPEVPLIIEAVNDVDEMREVREYISALARDSGD